MRTITLSLVISLLLTSVVWPNGCRLVSDDQELLYMLSAINAEDTDAMTKLAAVYGQDNCPKSNTRLSFNWYYIAALKDDPAAQHFLGNYYYYGIGVEKDIDESIKWFLRAANSGISGSKVMLRNLYDLGLVSDSMLGEVRAALDVKGTFED